MSDKKSMAYVQLDSINVISIDQTSGIFVGTNTVNNWVSKSYQNSGLGTVSGQYNEIHHNLNTVIGER